MSDAYQRVQMLASTGRYDMAERELRGMLAQEPRDSTAHALLALILLSNPERMQEATEEARISVGIEPDSPLTHYALAQCYVSRNQNAEAETAIMEALRLDPYDADAYCVLSRSFLKRERYQDALDAAEQGLAVDAEHLDCGNLRSIALERLGRDDEAVASASANLARNPDNAMSHAAHGWTLLNSGRYEEAQVAFREALRLDPTDEMARSGLMQALNGRSFVFRFVHRFYVAMSRLNSRAAFGLIFGAWILIQVLSRIGDNVPWLSPFITPILIVYVLFVVLTWIANPLFNTFLRFHPMGQHLLDRSERWSSNLIAPFLALSVFALIVGWQVDGMTLGLIGAGFWLGATILVAATFAMPTPQRKMLVGGFALLAVLIPVVGILRAIGGGSLEPFVGGLQTYGYSLLGIQIASGLVAAQPVRR